MRSTPAPPVSVSVVRADPVRSGLLYAGTQHGAFISFDDGERWVPFKNGLSDTPVTDLVVHPREDEIVIATHGGSGLQHLVMGVARGACALAAWLRLGFVQLAAERGLGRVE